MKNNSILIRRKLPAPIEEVWEAWTDPQQLMQWKSPESMTTPEATVDLKVGGEYSVTMERQPDPGKVTVRGVYKEIEKPTKLVFTWKWDGQEEETTVTVELKALSDTETELTLTHEGFVTEESKAQHNKGWESTFNKLEQFVQK